MQTKKIISPFVLLGTLLFNLLFWKEKMGLNVLLFDLFIMAGIFWLHPEVRREKMVVLTAIGTILTACCIVYTNSLFSKTVHLLSLTSFVGFAHVTSLKFIGDAFGIGLASILEAPLKVVNLAHKVSVEDSTIRPVKRWVRLSIIPTIVVLIFYSIYAVANPQFAEISTNFWTGVVDLTFPNISAAHFAFIIIGFFLVGGMLWHSVYYNKFEKAPTEENLHRSRFTSNKRILGFKPLDLKNEYHTAMIVIISLNVLLFLVNQIDFYYVWGGFAKVTPEELSDYVHKGTYLLIVAILLGMFILVYYFRKNLNFYPGNNILKIGAFVWIVQNGILAISVAIRNIRYIDHYGLAYKRLGVFIFLIMVLIGLGTLYFKVKEKRSLHYLLHRNGWALYFVLIVASFINWDVMITRYNISVDTKSIIDIPYLINDLSDKNIYVLYQHHEILKKIAPGENGFQNMLADKVRGYERAQKNYTWLSWNLADQKNW